jgi:cardiolipin synthase
MSSLWEVIAQIGIELHPDRVEYMAKKIMKVNTATDLMTTSFKQGLNVRYELLIQLKNSWENEPGISAKEISAALKSAAVTSHNSIKRQGLIELVWTGPSTDMVPVRHTEQVLKEVIDSAQNKIFVVSFVAYELPSIVSSLNKAIGRNVKIDILLEVSNEHGGRVSNDSIGIMKEMITSLNIYVWDQYKRNPSNQLLGAVHSKCILADRDLAFITSANLTKAAMDKNMELGVLIKGGRIPEKLDLHFEALKTTGIIKKV